MKKRGEILSEALQLVTKDRNETYGEPQQQLAHVQAIKHAVSHHFTPDLSPVEVEAIDMICVKLSRIVSGSVAHTDNWIDLIGYAAIGAEACEIRVALDDDGAEEIAKRFAPERSNVA